VWNLRTRQKISCELPKDPDGPAYYHPGHEWITFLSGGTLYLWDPLTKDMICTIGSSEGRKIDSYTPYLDGSHILIIESVFDNSSTPGRDRYFLTLRYIPSAESVASAEPEVDIVCLKSLQNFIDDRMQRACFFVRFYCSEDNGVLLWGIAANTLRIIRTKAIRCHSASPDGNMLVLKDESLEFGGKEPLVVVDEFRREATIVPGEGNIKAVSFLPDGKQLAIILRERVELWEISERAFQTPGLRLCSS